MKSGQITIKDLARELGISPSTVSRALKDHPGISDKTKRLVVALAKKLQYEPNAIALSLRSRKTHTIGVIIPKLAHFFFSTVISGIEDVAYGAGYNVILCQSNESFKREVMDVNALLTHRVDGLLVSISLETTSFDHFQAFQDRGLPLIFFDRILENIPVSSVVIDDEEGAFKAVEHLIEQDCRRILHLAGPEKLMISKDRKQGYIKALQKHRIEVSPELIINCSELEDAEKVVSQLLEEGLKMDGIFANNDLTAIGAMNAIKKAGLDIPGDIAVVGFSNWQMASMVEPALSSVNQPGFEMGQRAAQMFIDQMGASTKSVHSKVVLESDLVIRASSLRNTKK